MTKRMRLFILIKLLLKHITLLRRKHVHDISLSYIGTDATPADKIDDVIACAESLTTILVEAGVMNRIIPGTWTLNEYFKRNKKWVPTTNPKAGDVLVSPTGTGNGSIRGHTAIVGNNGTLMSNDSYTGKWMAHYTLETWAKRYREKGGMPMNFYTLL